MSSACIRIVNSCVIMQYRDGINWGTLVMFRTPDVNQNHERYLEIQ